MLCHERGGIYGFCIKHLRSPPLQIVHGALDSLAAPVQNMGVNHGGLHILVTQKFLNSPDVIAALQELGGKGMPESMACGALGRG